MVLGIPHFKKRPYNIETQMVPPFRKITLWRLNNKKYWIESNPQTTSNMFQAPITSRDCLDPHEFALKLRIHHKP